uniref:Uncharacterized protein n=1 Tax=Knipowitschia caucasica TaxID=637954 RepID=A0AAV2JNS4_KNICA
MRLGSSGGEGSSPHVLGRYTCPVVELGYVWGCVVRGVGGGGGGGCGWGIRSGVGRDGWGGVGRGGELVGAWVGCRGAAWCMGVGGGV